MNLKTLMGLERALIGAYSTLYGLFIGTGHWGWFWAGFALSSPAIVIIMPIRLSMTRDVWERKV